MKENTAKKATCCHKCGRVHVKGTACKRPYLTGKDSCAVNEVQDLKEFFSKPLKEAELKLGVKYELPNGDTGYIMTQSSDDPKDWIFSDGFKKVPYLSVKNKLKPLATQPGKYDGAFDLGLGKGHHIDEGPHQGKTEEELRSYIKGLMKDRSSAATKGQDGLVSGINKEIKQLAKELKKRETTITEGEKTIKGPFTYETVQDLVSRYGRDNGLFFRRKSNGELYGVGSIFLASDEPDFAVVDTDGYEDYMDYSDIDYVVIEDIKESTIAEAKKMTLGNYLDDLDSRFVDFMRAADGKNAKGSQGIDMLATINHNFNLFRNYISSIKKEYSSELNKELTFSIDESNITEASVPSNIKSFAKRKGVTALVNKVAGWAEKVGARISGGTAIGYNYSTLVLDMKYQEGEIRINTDNDTIKLYNTPVNSFPEFKKIYDEKNPIDKEKTNENVAQKVIGKIKEAKPGLWANINAKQKRGEKPSHGNSDAYKSAVKAGKEINKLKEEEGVPHYTKDGKLYDGPTHKDASGKLMTGDTHTSKSEYLSHKEDLNEVEEESEIREYTTDYQRRREKEGDYQQPKKDRPAPKTKAPKNDYFAKRKAGVEESMSEEEWNMSKEEDRLQKLPIAQQQKIKQVIAMMKAEKKLKK